MGKTESHNAAAIGGNGCRKGQRKQRQKGGEAPLSISGRGRREGGAGNENGLKSCRCFVTLLLKKSWTKHQSNNFAIIK